MRIVTGDPYSPISQLAYSAVMTWLTSCCNAGETQACADAASERIGALEEAAELAAAESEAAAAEAAAALRSAKLESLEAAEAAMAELMTLQGEYGRKLSCAQVGRVQHA